MIAKASISTTRTSGHAIVKEYHLFRHLMKAMDAITPVMQKHLSGPWTIMSPKPRQHANVYVF